MYISFISFNYFQSSPGRFQMVKKILFPRFKQEELGLNILQLLHVMFWSKIIYHPFYSYLFTWLRILLNML